MQRQHIGRNARAGKRGRPIGSGINDHKLLIQLAIFVSGRLRRAKTTLHDSGLIRLLPNPTETSLRALSRLVAQTAPGHNLTSTADRLRRKFRSDGDRYLKIVQEYDKIRGTQFESNLEAFFKDFNDKYRRLDALLVNDPELNDIVRIEPLKAGDLCYLLPEILDQTALKWIQSSPKLGQKLG